MRTERYDGHYYICLERRPGVPKWVPGWCGGRAGREAAATLLAWSSRSSPRTVSAAFVEQIIDEDGVVSQDGEWVQLTAFLGAEPRSVVLRLAAQPGVGLVAPFSDLMQHVMSRGYLDNISASDRPGTCPGVHASVNKGFWKNFLQFLREGELGF